MRLSTKHASQQTISFKDFSGGLNTTKSTESIAQNELSRALNVCLDKSTGLLRTVQGTDELVRDDEVTFDVLMIDPATGEMLITDTANKLYAVWMQETSGSWVREFAAVKIGSLTGSQRAKWATWEDGLVIASGGKLQYYHSGSLETINESPAVCNGVFVRDGRVWTWYNDRIHMSGVGDKHNWTHDNNDASSAQYVDIGYKDRGTIKGVATLISDVIIFKDNGHAYHLLGQYPDWEVKSIGRQLGVRNFDSCLTVGNSVLVIGDGRIQSVDVTQDYGDMKATSVSHKVEVEIRQISSDVRMRYVPTEDEVWLIDGDAEFLVYDVQHGAFFSRRYNSPVRDVCTRDGDTFILKQHCLAKVSDSYLMNDEELPMEWEIQAQTLVSYNDLLLKRIYIDTTPLFDNFVTQKFRIGDVEVEGGMPPTAKYLYHNLAVIPHNGRYLCDTYYFGTPITDTSEYLYRNDRYLWRNKTYMRSLKCYRATMRCVDHRRSIPVTARGFGGVSLFNQLAYDVVEV